MSKIKNFIMEMEESGIFLEEITTKDFINYLKKEDK